MAEGPAMGSHPNGGLQAVEEGEESQSATIRHDDGMVEGSEDDSMDPEASAAATLASVAFSTTGGAPAIPSPLPAGYNKDQPICANCSTQTTPLWRRSQDSTSVLCNACALFFKMKGRPRPISLKTDVIKSRNRSKRKSESKERVASGSPAPALLPKGKARGESTSRSRGENGQLGRKSAPGGSEMDEDELDLEDSMGKKSRKSPGQNAYGMPPGPYGSQPYPYPYPYPYQHLPPHPHQHQPYPPPRARSNSHARRAQSLDSRSPYAPGQLRGVSSGDTPHNYPSPPPGYHPGAPGLHQTAPEGYYPYYPYPQGYPGQPQPAYYPQGASTGYPHPGSHILQPPSIIHAQSDSRSRSPSVQRSEIEESPRSSSSPPLRATHPITGPSHLYQSYNQSPLSASSTGDVDRDGSAPLSQHSGATVTNVRLPGLGDLPSDAEGGRVTLAPIVFDSSHVPSPRNTDSRPKDLPPLAPSFPVSVPRHTGLFTARYDPSSQLPPLAQETSEITGRRRRSFSSTSAVSISSSEGGIRSPGPKPPLNGWDGSSNWTAEDEHRGRPERRYDDIKGKARDFQHLGEIREGLDPSTVEGENQSRMVGVENGLGELRVVDGVYRVASVSRSNEEADSRSRSSGYGGEERGRPRGLGGRSQSTSSARGRSAIEVRSSSATSSGRPSSISAEQEIARLKNKVSELTFLNSLMQSRLGQLEGPGKVPVKPIAAFEEEEEDMLDEDEGHGTGETEEDLELKQFGVTAQDPAMRAQLLAFFRSQTPASGRGPAN